MVKISSLELENVKRIKAVYLEPTANGLTIIGGDNNQGKTSVLDSIAWALGGEKYRPSAPNRTGSTLPAKLSIRLDNGLIVERTGKNGTLKVTDPAGKKTGQTLLNEFVSTFALDLPKFLNSSGKEKCEELLKIIGIGPQLKKLDSEYEVCYNQRHDIGVLADQKKKHASLIIYYPNMPDDLVSAADLIKRQQDILAKNGENQRLREQKIKLQELHNELTIKITELRNRISKVDAELTVANKTAAQLQDESTAELEENIKDIDTINIKISSNKSKEQATKEAETYQGQYDDLTNKMEQIQLDRKKMLEEADLPLPGLSVKNGCLVYNDQPWDNMSASDQLKVAASIVRKLNPECGFVLIDKMEQMDVKSLQAFGKWAQDNELQIIGTRVSEGKECSVIIEDGCIKEPMTKTAAPKKWKEGEF